MKKLRALRSGTIYNLLSLSGLRILSSVSPFIVLPYLVRVLGPEGFGIVSLAQAFAGFFFTIVTYGFSLTATREVALKRDNYDDMRDIYASVISARVLLAGLSTVLGIILIFAVSALRQHWPVYVFSLLQVWGLALFANWLFLGVERMQFLALSTLIIQLIYISGVFILVSSPSDLTLVPLSLLAGHLIAALFSIAYIKSQMGLSIRWLGLRSCRAQLRKAFVVFFAVQSTAISIPSIVFSLGFLLTALDLGIFTAVQRLVIGGVLVLKIICDATFPEVTRKLSEDKMKGAAAVARAAQWMLLFSVLASAATILLSEAIVVIVFGLDYQSGARVLSVLSLIFVAAPLNTIIGTHVLLSIGARMAFAMTNLIPLLAGVPLLFIIAQGGCMIHAAWVTVAIFAAMCLSKIGCLAVIDWMLFKIILGKLVTIKH